MGAFFSQIFALLTVPPGNFIYHVVLVFSIAGALQSAFMHWRSSEFPQVRRAMFGLGVLLAAQVVLFGISSLAWLGWVNANSTLPVLDRALAVFGILWITWLWAFPEPSRPADAATALLSLFLIAATGLALLLWAPRSSALSYNFSADDWLWQIVSIGLLLIGILILLLRRPNGYGNGLALLVLLLLGHAAHLFIAESGNYAGVIRLAAIAAYPILLTIPQRFPAPAVQPAVLRVDKSEPPTPEQRRYSAEPKTVHALLALAAESSAPKVSEAIARAIAQTMLADLCFLVYLTENKGQLVIASGYDLIREETLEGGNLKRTAVPMLTNAIQRGRPLRLPASGTSADIKGFSEVLGLPNPGNMMEVPILTPEKESLGGVIVLSPYSNRPWSAEDQAFLANMAISLVPIMQRSQKVSKLEQVGDQAKQGVEQAQQRIAELEQRNDELERRSQDLFKQTEELNRQIEQLGQQADSESSKSAEMAEMATVYEQSQKTIEQLRAELQTIRSNGKAIEPQLQQDLNNALRDVARLQNQLAESNRKVLELEKT